MFLPTNQFHHTSTLKKWPKLALHGMVHPTKPAPSQLIYLKTTTNLLTKLETYTQQQSHVWFQQYKKTHVRFLIRQQNTSFEFSKLIERNHCLTEITSANIASAAKVDVKLRFSKMVEKITARAARKLMLSIGFITFNVFIKGQSSCFALFWKTLNNPSNEIYLDPVFNELTVDVLIKAKKTITNKHINDALDAASNLELKNDTNKLFQQSVFKLKSKLLDKNNQISLYRLALSWNCIFIIPSVNHCVVKLKKARSIKKRLTKRFTTLAQRRLWIV